MPVPLVDLKATIAGEELKNGPTKAAVIMTGNQVAIWWNQGYSEQWVMRVLQALLRELNASP